MTGNEMMYGAVGGGAVASAAWGLMVMVLRRQATRVLEHVDDRAMHIDPRNGYVRESGCLQRHRELKEDAAERRQEDRAAVASVHERVDALIEAYDRVARLQEDNVRQILAAISALKPPL
jgi:hypothetical protein